MWDCRHFLFQYLWLKHSYEPSSGPPQLGPHGPCLLSAALSWWRAEKPSEAGPESAAEPGPGQTRVQPSVPMEMSVWQVAESSHTDSTRLKCRKPSAKPQPTSDRWCFPSNTRDTPTRKAHRQSRILRGTWRTGGGHTWIRIVNCSSLCYLWSSKPLTASTRWFSRNLDTMTARLAWAAGNEYISMAM